VDGGTIENVLATNIHIVRVDSPIFLRLGDRGRVMPGMKRPAPGVLRHIVFDGITGDTNGSRGSIFSGIPTASISDVVVRNYNVRIEGGAAAFPADKIIEEKIGNYPDAFMFGAFVPAHGFWVRHARNVNFFKVQVRLNQPDARPLIASGGDTENLLVDGKLMLPLVTPPAN
jgi:hypothetical protein